MGVCVTSLFKGREAEREPKYLIMQKYESIDEKVKRKKASYMKEVNENNTNLEK